MNDERALIERIWDHAASLNPDNAAKLSFWNQMAKEAAGATGNQEIYTALDPKKKALDKNRLNLIADLVEHSQT